jgi:hypothetical protein
MQSADVASAEGITAALKNMLYSAAGWCLRHRPHHLTNEPTGAARAAAVSMYRLEFLTFLDFGFWIFAIAN